MAICLRRNFKSCSSFAFVGRRHRQTNCINRKTSIADPPFLKEMPPSEYFPLNISLNNCNQRVASKIQPFPDSVFCAQECKAYKEVQKEPESNPGRPKKDQLDHISDILIQDLPKLFVKVMNYKIYHRNIIFENNIKGTKTQGLLGYIREISLLKIIGHIKFANVKFHILKITVHPEDGTVRVRWRITGVSNYKAFFSFLKLSSAEKFREPEGWYDGFSIYVVKSDGLVHRHIVDKMMPDDEKVSNVRSNLAAKMAFAVGITMKNLLPDSLSCEGIQKNLNDPPDPEMYSDKSSQA